MIRHLHLISPLRSKPAFRGIKTFPVLEQAEVAPLVQAQVKDKIVKIDSERPFSPFLVDTFHRRHNYLRISLTERCNLRCFYCMPNDGVELSPRDHILTDDEVVRLATLFVKSGVSKIRLTGGEPTVRKGLVDIVARLSELRKVGLESIGMTTNGIALERRLPSLIEHGLTHLNLSLDTLDPFKFEIMTRRRGHEAVLRSLEAALLSNLRSVKLNVVIVKGLNDAEVLDFLEMTKDTRLSVRFIEFMPFTGNKWDKAKMVPSSELLAHVQAKHPRVNKAPDDLNDTARSYTIPGYKGSFGFISSMSDHFCGSCNRLRLTADGQIKVCLFDAKEISLRDQLRRGVTDAKILQTIGRAVRGKQEKHAGMQDIDVVTNRPMILIGGLHTVASNRRPGKLKQHISRSRGYRLLPTHRAVPAVRCFTSCAVEMDAIHLLHAPRLTHIDTAGRPSMVDVSAKERTKRTATATGRIYIPAVAYELVTSTYPIASSDHELHTPLATAKAKAKAKAQSKGDVLTVAQLAAIMGCKRTADLIPLCHPLQLSHISVTLHPEIHSPDSGRTDPRPEPSLHVIADSDVGCSCQEQVIPGTTYSICCRAEVSCEGKTGVEMEALTAVSVGLLTVWDMLKAIAGKEMLIGDIVVLRKEGGKSGDFVRENAKQ
ncbi:hypothetical protein AcV7_001123 [Taiwanofungus camphoratus]|nr:hypothetical protein AcV7_001123 [Antrodia cinnamomea]